MPTDPLTLPTPPTAAPPSTLQQVGGIGAKIAMAFLAAKQAGPQAAAAFMQGLNQRQLQDQQLARQKTLDQSTLQTQAAQRANLEADNARQQQQVDLAKQQQQYTQTQGTLGALDKFTGQVADTTADPTQAENVVMQRAALAASLQGKPPDTYTGVVNAVAPQLAAADKKFYRARLADLAKDPLYKDLVGTPEFEQMTVQGRDGHLRKIGDIRAQIGDQLTGPNGQPVLPPPKAEPVNAAAEDARYEKIQTAMSLNQPVDPAELAWSKAYEKRKTLVGTTTFNLNQGNRANAASDRDLARLDRSYQLTNTSLENLRKPLADQAERMGRLIDSVNQRTPQADALIAPELLTVMAGGMGSGLRMNEAEISRIVGGRTNFESLKAALNKWQTDPSKGLSITESQRAQVQALISTVQQRSTAKLDTITGASQALIDAPTVEAHRKIIADVRKRLTDLSGSATSTTGAKADPLGIR